MDVIGMLFFCIKYSYLVIDINELVFMLVEVFEVV